MISSPRIEIENTDNSISVLTISREEIQKSTATNVSELLQQIAGLDIRRRGAEGMQADLYIRGGSFDQTLLLIDGIKVEDPQTGHHTMNMTLPLEVIEKIEIIKGSASRIYGQNAFTGAVNIITKKEIKNELSIELSNGSFDQKRGSFTIQKELKNSDILFNYSRKESEGYRYNTDYENDEFFIKSNFKIKDHVEIGEGLGQTLRMDGIGDVGKEHAVLDRRAKGRFALARFVAAHFLDPNAPAAAQVEVGAAA